MVYISPIVHFQVSIYCCHLSRAMAASQLVKEGNNDTPSSDQVRLAASQLTRLLYLRGSKDCRDRRSIQPLRRASTKQQKFQFGPQDFRAAMVEIAEAQLAFLSILFNTGDPLSTHEPQPLLLPALITSNSSCELSTVSRSCGLAPCKVEQILRNLSTAVASKFGLPDEGRALARCVFGMKL